MGRSIFICFLFMAAWTLQNCDRSPARNALETRARLWQRGLDDLEAALEALEEACRSGDSRSSASDSALQAAFRTARLRYKAVEFLLEYAFPLSAARLNGPAVDEVEPEGTVIPAAGLQVLEESVFPRREGSPELLGSQVAAMRAVVRGIRGAAAFEPVGRSLDARPPAWTDSSVLDAMRLELFRLGSLGITGFDSPIAKASLPETRAALAGMAAYLAEAFPDPGVGGGRRAVARDSLGAALAAAAAAASARLDDRRAFDAFDRLRFLRESLNPAYARLGEFQEAVGAPLPAGPRAFSPASRDMFAEAWNPAYFSPFGGKGIDRASPATGGPEVALGRRLFSDPALSGDGSRSCATCHRPGQGFGDGLRRSPALGKGGFVSRNAPTLLHAGFQHGSFWELRVESLEDQAFQVIHNPAEMGGSLDRAAAALSGSPSYAAGFHAAFAGDPDADRETPVTPMRIRRALASYIRSLAPFDSPWDRYMRGDDGALDAEARLGFNLFMGKAGCATCHFPPLFNGSVPPLYLASDVEVLGVPAEPPALGRAPVLDPDSGRMAVDRQPMSRGAFRTPTVRNAALTAPYMHNGVFATLEEVVDFYDDGGGAGMGLAVPNQTLPSDSLRLSRAEAEALVAFMKALSDTAGTTVVSPPAPFAVTGR